MKIEQVKIDKKEGYIRIRAASKDLRYPISNLDYFKSDIVSVNVDEELGGEAVSVSFEIGVEESIHIDAFLEYSNDPDFYRDLTLYNICIEINNLVEASSFTQKQIAERLQTSTSQISRILNTTNYNKTIDQMVRVAAALDYELKYDFLPIGRLGIDDLRKRLKYVDEDELKHPAATEFIGLRKVC